MAEIKQPCVSVKARGDYLFFELLGSEQHYRLQTVEKPANDVKIGEIGFLGGGVVIQSRKHFIFLCHMFC